MTNDGFADTWRAFLANVVLVIMVLLLGTSEAFGASSATAQGTVVVESDEPGGEVRLDGRLVRNEGAADVVAVQVVPGDHHVTWAVGGHVIWEGRIVVRKGTRTVVKPPRS